MDKKYQVFISSTYIDMKAERQTAVEAILDAGHIPAGMELFSASDKKQIEVIKGWIDRSDIFMLVLGGRYGSVDPDSGKSYIQLEYEHAVATGKPFFALYLTDVAIQKKAAGELGLAAVEQNDTKALNEFRAQVKSRLCSEVEDLKDIRIHVPKAIRDLSAANKLEGWVRASSVPDVSPLISQLASLQAENERLKAMAQTAKAEPALLSGSSGGLSEERLDVSLALRFSYVQESEYAMPETGFDTWKVTYLSVFSLIAAKLLEEPSDSAVQAYLDKVLNQQLIVYEVVHIQEADFQAMKMKFVALGAVELRKIGNALCWTLTENGKGLLMKLHADA
ncbi:DUF4062 domain-containing protein [Burkholderia ambifaria]|uniref:DUF4062 domain-containing protein n=1 Tax=Burkholderia ambifaria MEX-5 TaxID=396597 RepID=B1T3Q7_9BURK|nr:DUF4062 domain-containing protein [Burkholderia ambifaria]EDT41772.1 hypothetical protein BamMEX5DRAFT_2423 [Burkholderia ambifaria MEX-5]